jgi:transcriptional regulator with XRE-family HTH domain
MVADEFGLTQATISSWESGRRGPDMHMLIHLAAFFDISVDGLLGRADPCVICQSTDRSRSYPAPESEGGGENILCANCSEAVAS